jgi:hypothetical protein
LSQWFVGSPGCAICTKTEEEFALSLSYGGQGFCRHVQEGKVLIRPKGASPDTTVSIGVREGNLYRLKGKPVQALVHDSDNLCELWHRRMGHLHYRALSILREIVTGLPDFSIEQQGVCRGCALGKNAKAAFPSNKSRSKGILDLIHSDVCGPRSVAEDEEQEAPKGEQHFKGFQFRESTFRWGGGVSPFQFCQETQMVHADIEGCSGAC